MMKPFQITVRTSTPLRSALAAAAEFKYLLDVQVAGTLFNPGGKGDARSSAGYALAAELLDQAVSQSADLRAPNRRERIAKPVQIVDTNTTRHPAHNGCVILILLALVSGGIDFIMQVWPA
jgi:hypothetical protein